MKVVPVDHGLELGKSAPGYVRGEGLHMSEIYNSLYQELEPDRYSKDSAPDPLRMEAGLALEEMLEEGLRKRLTPESGRPGELVGPHNILFSPDMIIFNGVTRVGEIKLTWMSCREMPTHATNGLPPKFSKYLTQMLAYCHCVETPYARLIGFFVNGDYDRTKAPSPKLLAWDFEFTARELRENFEMLVNHAKQRRMIL